MRANQHKISVDLYLGAYVILLLLFLGAQVIREGNEAKILCSRITNRGYPEALGRSAAGGDGRLDGFDQAIRDFGFAW